MSPVTLHEAPAQTADTSFTQSELEKITWIHGVYLSPGTFNLGVTRGDKDWNSSMIQASVCGVLNRTASSIKRIRFVDANEVIYQNKSAVSAEITVFTCP